MDKGSCLIELRPDRLLLDPSFEGYKLSLDSIPIHRQTIDSGVKVIQPSDEQYSFYHVKLFSFHNHLHANPFARSSAYFVDKLWKVFKVTSSSPNQVIALKEVFQIPSTLHHSSNSYNPSIVFATSDLVALSDGSGLMYLAKVTGQENDEVWQTLHSDSLLSEDANYILSDARVELVNNKRVLHVLLIFVDEKGNNQKDVKGGLFQSKVKWRTFVEESCVWEARGSKELCIDGSVDYIALEPGCRSLYIISDKLPKWVHDSENPLQPESEAEPELKVKTKLYTWTQTEEEISVLLLLMEETSKTDVMISVTDLQLEVKIKENSVISGKLFHRVSKDLTTWSFEKNQIVIQLTKHESGLMWSSLIPGDDRGEETIDPELAKSVHNKLAHLCSEEKEKGSAISFNSQQLEECDAVSCDTTSLFRINGETHSTTHTVSLSSLQWLFKVSCDPREAPAICVRHDVDACVWQFGEAEDEKTWPHKHVGTFFAFGYVQASKSLKKFVASPSDLSYVAVCEASHHIYVYRQPSPLSSQLKNRFTRKKVDTISKQQLVNLEAKDQILGVHATNNLLFVLLENAISILVINT